MNKKNWTCKLLFGYKYKKAQEKYCTESKKKIKELIERCILKCAKLCSTSMEPGYLNINVEDILLPNNKMYRQATGALIYMVTITRPYISASVNIPSRRNEKLREKDWNAVKNYQCLKTTEETKIIKIYSK